MMGAIIKFDPQEGRKGLDRLKTEAMDANKYLAALSNEITGAQQSLAARKMIADGYCGPALKAEIACANRLAEHIAMAGKIVQAMIMENMKEGGE